MNFTVYFKNQENAYYFNRNRVVFNISFNWQVCKKFLGINHWHRMSVEDAWSLFRAKYCPQVITKYGRIGLKLVGDERTLATKFCDVISDFMMNHRTVAMQKRAWANRNGFSFFDWRFGRKITNLDEIHRIEKETGTELLSWRDIDVERSKQRRMIEAAAEDRIAKGIHNVFHQVRQGRKYTKEIDDHRRKVAKKFGLVGIN